MVEKVKNDVKKLNIDVNKLGKVVLGGITLKRIKTHIKQCESCESTNYHVWMVQMGVKSIGTITYCQDCMEHQQWGAKLVEKDIDGMIPSFQMWLHENMHPIAM